MLILTTAIAGLIPFFLFERLTLILAWIVFIVLGVALSVSILATSVRKWFTSRQ